MKYFPYHAHKISSHVWNWWPTYFIKTLFKVILVGFSKRLWSQWRIWEHFFEVNWSLSSVTYPGPFARRPTSLLVTSGSLVVVIPLIKCLMINPWKIQAVQENFRYRVAAIESAVCSRLIANGEGRAARGSEQKQVPFR